MATRGFLVADTDDMERIARGMTTHIWSGIVWKSGYRRGANFLYSDFAVFDFDSPDYPLAQAVKSFVDCVHVIGLTRNHQKPKGGVVCDRYRVVVPWERRIEDRAEFEWNMRRLTEVYDMDRQCKDAGRGYYPCTEIVSVATDGLRQEVERAPTPEKRQPSVRTKNGWPSSFAIRTLKTVVPIGERSSQFWRVAKDLLRVGYDHDEILSLIVSSATYKGEITPHALMKVKEAIKTAHTSLANEDALGREERAGTAGGLSCGEEKKAACEEACT